MLCLVNVKRVCGGKVYFVVYFGCRILLRFVYLLSRLVSFCFVLFYNIYKKSYLRNVFIFKVRFFLFVYFIIKRIGRIFLNVCLFCVFLVRM